MSAWSDVDRYVEERGIPEEDHPAAFALWIAETTGGPVPKFEKVEREPPADGIVIEGDELSPALADLVRFGHLGVEPRTP